MQEFDSLECLAAWARTAPPGTVRTVYVIDVQHPGAFVRADGAGFLKGVIIKSPMGHAVVAFATPQAAEQQRAMLGGTLLTWTQLVADSARTPAGSP